jgi:DHA2 family multidrug resistance protein-like MFS transporter
MTPNLPASAPARATAREWLGLAVLVLPVMALAIDVTILHLAAPKLSADLSPSGPQLLWIVDIYGFLIVGFLVTMGTLGDRIGRRRLLLGGATAFDLASVLAAFSTSPEMLILARALLGVSGAALMPSTMSLLRNMFRDPRQRAVAVAVWTSGFAGGAALGPLVGGIMLEHFWWGSVFLVAVPVMALLVVLGPFVVPEFRDPEPGPVDLRSALLLLVTLLSAVYALKKFAANEIGAVPLLALLAGVALAVLFVRRQRRLRDPLLDLELMANRVFSVSLGMVLISALAFTGAQFLIAQYLQMVRGLSPLTAGLWSLPATCSMLLMILAAPLVARRVPMAHFMAFSLTVMAVGLLALTRAGPDTGLPVVVIAFTVLGIGTGPTMALGTHMATSAAPPEKTGTAAGVMETSGELGMSLGIALLGSLSALVYRTRIAGDVPETVPADAARAAQDTIGGAMAAAEELPAETGGELADAAARAFTQGMHLAAVIGAVLVLAIAAGLLLARRRVNLSPDPDPKPDPGPEPEPEPPQAPARPVGGRTA